MKNKVVFKELHFEVYNDQVWVYILVVLLALGLKVSDFLSAIYIDADPENDYLHLHHHVTYADVIIVSFHDILYQLKNFELQSNFACSSHNDPETRKFIILCRHDDELLVNWLKILSTDIPWYII